MNLRDVLSDLYSPIRGISDRTITLYQFTLASFGAFLGHEPTTADLEQLVVAKFLAWRLRNRSPGTAAKDRAQLRALWDFCAREKLVEKFPTMRTIVVPERIPQAWLSDEMQRLVESAAQEVGSIDGVPAGDWFRALMLLCYDTGERSGSVMALPWSNVLGNQVIFSAEERKGRRRDIVRPISEATVAALEKIRQPYRDLVFPWPWARSVLYHRMDRVLKRAGLPSDRKSKFHRIRKTTASYYAAAGGDAQRLLDHSSPAVTRRYLDPRIVAPEIDAPAVLPKVC